MSDLAAGKDRTLLNFWGSWCVPCRDEIPLLAAYAASAAPQATVVGVLYKDAAGPGAAAAEQLGATWENLVDADGTIAGQIPVNAAPLTLLLNASGEVLDYQVGPFATLEEIDAFVSGEYEPDELPLLHPACGVSAVRRVASNPSLRLRVTTKELTDR
jgi:thiol-disulfide isomerase/thioredoxin